MDDLGTLTSVHRLEGLASHAAGASRRGSHADSFVSCDWGTTNLRLRLVDGATGEILREVTAPVGIKETYRSWQAACRAADDGAREGRVAFFFEALRPYLDALGSGAAVATIVISGMASSSIGMCELPYASLPFRLDGADVLYRVFEVGTAQVVLVSGVFVSQSSGVRPPEDVIRGEETQMIGLWSGRRAPALPESQGSPESQTSPDVFVLPGTHSKHVFVAGGAIRDFRTFMTGELFELLVRDSILRDSVRAGPFRERAFREGVAASHDEVMHTLFTVRARGLSGGASGEDNYWYLSGLLVGTELRGVARADVSRCYVCAAATLEPTYRTAVDALGLASKTTIVDPLLAERAAVMGHRAILQRIVDGAS